MQTSRIFNMADDRVISIAAAAPKGQILKSLAKAHAADEAAAAKARPSAPAASRPAAPPRPAASRPTAATGKPTPLLDRLTGKSPAPAATAPAMPSAQSIASALLDETEKRRVASLSKTRAEFTNLKPSEALKFIKSGGRII